MLKCKFYYRQSLINSYRLLNISKSYFIYFSNILLLISNRRIMPRYLLKLLTTSQMHGITYNTLYRHYSFLWKLLFGRCFYSHPHVKYILKSKKLNENVNLYFGFFFFILRFCWFNQQTYMCLYKSKQSVSDQMADKKKKNNLFMAIKTTTRRTHVMCRDNK